MFTQKFTQSRASPETGQSLVEYALILMLVAIVVIVILAVLGPQISYIYLRAQGALLCSGYVDEIEADIAAGTVPSDSWLAIGNTSNCLAVTTTDPPQIHKVYGPP